MTLAFGVYLTPKHDLVTALYPVFEDRPWVLEPLTLIKARISGPNNDFRQMAVPEILDRLSDKHAPDACTSMPFVIVSIYVSKHNE